MVEILQTVANAAVDAELRRLREQVTSLQTDNTRLVEANRALSAGQPPDIVAPWKALAKATHELAESKGWWDEDKLAARLENNFLHRDPRQASETIVTLKTFTALALIMSEISEGIEGLRVGAKSEKIPGFENIEEELADAVIRIMDLGHTRGWRVPEAILAKHSYNATRAYRHGNKAA